MYLIKNREKEGEEEGNARNFSNQHELAKKRWRTDKQRK